MKNLVIALLLMLLVISVLLNGAKAQGAAAAPLVHADYQRCMRVVPGPIVQHRRGVILYPQLHPEIS